MRVLAPEPADQRVCAHSCAAAENTPGQGASWSSKYASEGAPGERRRPLDALLGCANHAFRHAVQRRAVGARATTFCGE